MSTAVSLFAGSGGVLGLQQAGLDVRLAIDKHAAAIEALQLNRCGVRCWQAKHIEAPALLESGGLEPGATALLLGGAPLLQQLDVVVTIKPRRVLLEGPVSLLSKGPRLHQICTTLIDAGYGVRVHKIYAESYGLPQRRRRVFIAGVRGAAHFSLPEPTHVEQATLFDPAVRTVQDAIGDLPDPHPDGTPSDHWTPPLNGRLLATIQALAPGQRLKDLPSFQPQLRRGANGQLVQARPFRPSADVPAGLKRLHAHQPAATLTSSALRQLIHPHQDRFLTVRECARLHSFPDAFRLPGPLQVAHLAASVPPLLIQVFATHLMEVASSDAEPGALVGYYLTNARSLSASLRRTAGYLDGMRLR